MLDGWTDRVPPLHGDLTTLREVAASDVYTLFTLFSDPAVTAYMAPPPPTLARFAGFVEWSHQQRAQGHGVCFGIVPDGMTAAVGILQVQLEPTLSDAEWGFVLVLISGPRACFPTRPTCSWSLRSRPCTLSVSKRASLCAIGAHTPPCKNSVRGSRRRSRGRHHRAFPRDPESVWTLREADLGGTGRAILGCQPTTRCNGSGRRSKRRRASLRRSDAPETVEPYPLFLFDRRRRE